MVVVASEIGGLVGSLAGIGKNAAAQDWIATGLGAGALGMETAKIVVKGIAERRIQAEVQQQLAQRTNPWAAEVPIIEWGIVAITVFEFTLGLGDASKGGEFDTARSKLELPESDLGRAFPDSRWEGTGSEHYAAQNKAQLDRVSAIRKQDQAMMDALTAEAAQLTEIRRAVAGIKDGLTACIFVALLIKAQGTDAASLVFQKVVTLAAIAATVTAIGYMEYYSGTTTKPKLKKVVDEYQKLIAEMTAYLADSTTAPFTRTAAAKESRVSAFATGLGSMGMPDTSTSAGEATSTESTILPSLNELLQMAGQPASGTPGLDQPTQAPARDNGPAGQISPLAAPLATQPAATGRHRKAATAAVERDTAEAPAPAEAAADENTDVAGAAAGTDAIAHAPVELTAPDNEPAQEPNRL